MTWGWTGVRGTWATPAAEASLDALTDLGGNWVTIAFAALQATAQSTTIDFRSDPVVTDDEVRWAIRAAQDRGLRTCLKPVVNCADGTWRAWIGFFDQDVPGEPSWSEWFASYTAFLRHYARIAEEERVDLFCVGCEMVRSDGREADWRRLIEVVRSEYTGLITYNCDKYQEDRLTWWDAVDVISSSGYYPTGTWPEHLDRIEAVVREHNKPFVFLEAGCPSREGSRLRPNDWTLEGAPSGPEQDAYYREMFEQCRERDWVGGFMLWDWPAVLYDAADAADNEDYCPYGKPAAATIREEFLRRTGV
jgi:hypothetical protein